MRTPTLRISRMVPNAGSGVKPDADGIGVADAAAAQGAKTIVMSAYLFSTPEGAADHHEIMMKPMRPSELVAAVQRMIGRA